MATNTLPNAPSFPVTGDAEADALLATDPFALLLGMLLDQQVPMEWAFRSPWRLRERIGSRFSPAGIAKFDPDELKAVFTEVPALHRFPGSMATRVLALSHHLVDTYDGVTERLWLEARTGDELLRRLRELPGFGEEKARIFVALLAKRFGVRPRGWKAPRLSFRSWKAAPSTAATAWCPTPAARRSRGRSRTCSSRSPASPSAG